MTAIYDVPVYRQKRSIQPKKKHTHTHGALHTTHKAHTAHTTHKDMTHSTQHIKNIRQDKSNHAVERVPTNFSHFAQITIEMT